MMESPAPITGRARRGAWIAALFLGLSCVLSCSSYSVPAHKHSNATALNLREFGAAGDGISDDGPALQRALDALAISRGGTLVVPPGSYAIATPVSKDFSALASSITIVGQMPGVAIDVAGNGSGLNLTSEFIVKVGKEHVALDLKCLDDFRLKDIAFVGVTGVRDDAHIMLSFDDIDEIRIEHCEFYGLSTLTPDGAIIAASRSGLHVDQTAFLGCTANSAVSNPIIQNLTWQDIAITNTKFIDYGNRPGQFSKTGLAAPHSWISIGNAATAKADSGRRQAVIRNVFLDEAALIAILAQPDRYSSANNPFDVFISAVRINVSNLATWGIYLTKVDKVLIEDTHLGWSHNADAAIVLKDVKDAILDRVECVADANTIRADRGTHRLVVIDSIYETLDSAAPDTKVIKTRNPIEDPVQSVRREYLGVLGIEPEPRELHFWADLILKCEGDASCLARRRTEFAESLVTTPTRP